MGVETFRLKHYAAWWTFIVLIVTALFTLNYLTTVTTVSLFWNFTVKSKTVTFYKIIV